jgi:hypothetical protein
MISFMDLLPEVNTNKSFCGGPGGGFFKKSPLVAEGQQAAEKKKRGQAPNIITTNRERLNRSRSR